jgi:hypothetical protein
VSRHRSRISQGITGSSSSRECLARRGPGVPAK